MSESLFGREAELAILERALARAAFGEPRAVLIGGEPGIGKTRLVATFSERVKERGLRVAWGRAWDGGGAPSYWPMVQVLRSIIELHDGSALKGLFADHAEIIATLAPELGRKLAVAASGGTFDRFELFDAVSSVLHRAALERPIVVVFDDLHAMDASTLAMLRFLCRAAHPSKLLLLGTHRTSDVRASEEVKSALAELAREATAIQLVGLEPDAVGAWISEIEGAKDLERAREVSELTAGNPLFIEGVLREGREKKLPLVSKVRGSITTRLAALPEDSRRLIEAAAVIGRPAAIALLARVLHVPFEALLEPVGRAVEAGLLVETGELGSYRFHHPLVQEVAYEALVPSARAMVHRRTMEALSELYGTESSAHLSELARHALAAAPLGTADRAAALCHAAGKRALELAAFEEAAHHFADARAAISYLEGGSAPPVPLAVVIGDLGEAELAAGKVSLARGTFESLAELGRSRRDPRAIGRAALGFARTFEFGVLEPRRLSMLEEAVAALEPDDSSLLARVLAKLAQELWMVAGREASRKEIADRAIAMGERLGDDDATAFALNAWLLSVWGPEHRVLRLERAEALLRIADRTGNLERLVEAHRWRINVAIEAGEIGRAESAIADYTEVAKALRRPDYLANAVMRQALLPQLRGDFVRAEELAKKTHELQLRAGDPQADVVFDSRSIMIYEATGRIEELRPLLPSMKTHVEARQRFALYRAIFIRGLLAAGEREAANAEWQRIWNADLSDVSRDIMWPALLCLLVPACITLGERTRAERLYALLSPLAPLHASIGASYSLGSAARYVGLLAGFLGRREEAVRHLEEALTMNERMGAAWQVEQTKHDLARLRSAKTEASEELARLHPEGAVWLVEHRGVSARIKGSVGLTYLKTLLERPGKEVHALDLAGGASKDASQGAGPILDDRARAAYRERIEDLKDTIDEAESFADVARAERARAELEQLTEELGRAFGLGGRVRPVASDAERARTSVAKAIARAIASIARELPELGQHLERAVRTGLFCAYDPDPRAKIDWSF
jgi:tetratricopeptide (TPR) repeat protein